MSRPFIAPSHSLHPTSLQIEKSVREIRHVHGAKSHRGVVAFAALVEPVVAARDRMERRIRAGVSLTRPSELVKRVVQQAEAAPLMLTEQRRDAAQLRPDKTGPPPACFNAISSNRRGVINGITGVRVCVK